MRVAFHTLGCRLNQFETEGMRSRLITTDHDVEIVDFDSIADLYVINSCAVTARAEQKCRQLARSIRRRNSAARIAVVGCYSQLAKESLAATADVDVVLGNEEKRRLDLYLERMSKENFTEVSSYRRGMPMAEEWIDSFGDHARATIKVQDGCDMRCSFCTIWKARGPSRSRAPRTVVEQARHLAARGYEELVLAGVHLGHYGRDLDPPSDLVGLLEMLFELLDPSVRIRLSSLDPGEVGEDLLDLMEREPRLCRYLHLALQSGSDRVLEAMRRGYRRADFESLVASLHRRGLDVGMGVDVIVGFPGETDEDFEQTLELLAASPAAFHHVFRYSERPGSGAQRIPGKVPGSVAADRSRRLREQGEAARRAFLSSRVGREVEAIAVGESGDTGLTEWMLDDYATVWAACPEDPGRARHWIRIECQRSDGELLGRLTGRPVALESQRGTS